MASATSSSRPTCPASWRPTTTGAPTSSRKTCGATSPARRGTSLEYGIVQARGIRCCYHGGVFDVDGRILETPGEPADSTLKQRLCHGAYRTHEFCGLVFAYMGPPDARPVFPMYDTFDVPGLELHPAAQFLLPCNWLQVKDNSMDPVHTSFLHAISSGYHFTEAFGELAELEWQGIAYD